MIEYKLVDLVDLTTHGIIYQTKFYPVQKSPDFWESLLGTGTGTEKSRELLRHGTRDWENRAALEDATTSRIFMIYKQNFYT